jgi:hypothetical protein
MTKNIALTSVMFLKRMSQERMERRSRKRSSSAGSEKMGTVGDRWDKMEGHCSTCQSPQWAVSANGRRSVMFLQYTVAVSCLRTSVMKVNL